MTINNRGLLGQPTLPYASIKSYAGMDVFASLTFVDHTGTSVVPTTLKYQIDDISNAINMVPSTSIVAGLAAQMTVQLPGAPMVMSHQWQGSQLCQVYWTATALDSVTGTSFTMERVDIIELCSIQVPGN